MAIIYTAGFYRLVLRNGKYIVQWQGKDFCEAKDEKLGRYMVDHYEGI